MNKKYLLATIGRMTSQLKKTRQMQALLYVSLLLNILFAIALLMAWL